MTRAEIQALIDAAPDGRIGIHQAGRPMVSVPYGKHTLDGPIVIDAMIDVDFSGGVLIVPDGVQALDVRASGWGCRVRNLTVFGQSQNGAQHGASGIVMGAYGATLEHVLVRFCGTGIVWDGRQGEPEDASDTWLDNANAVFAENVKVFNCDLGIVVKGGDSNGGCFEAITVDNCRVGIQDESFLGNTWVGMHMHTIAEEGYRATSAANYSTVVGSYMEQDVYGGLKSQARITWVGGGAVPNVDVGDRVGLGLCRLGFYDKLPGGGYLTATLPHGAANSAMTVRRYTDQGGFVNGLDAFRFQDNLSQCGLHWYGGSIANDGLTRPFLWSYGNGLSRVDAQHYSIGSALGHEGARMGDLDTVAGFVDDNTAALDTLPLRRVTQLPAQGEAIGDLVLLDSNGALVPFEWRDDGNGPEWVITSIGGGS